IVQTALFYYLRQKEEGTNMARLEDLTRGAAVKGILPDSLVTVVDVKWHGSAVVELIYKDASGRSEEHTSELQSLTNLVCRLLNHPSPSEIYTLSLHDALPIYCTNCAILLSTAERRRNQHGSARRSDPRRRGERHPA